MTEEPTANHPPEAPGPRFARKLLWIGTIWVMGLLGATLANLLTWTHSADQVQAVIIENVVFSPLWLIFTLPAASIGLAISRWHPLRKWRLALSWALAAVFPLWAVIDGLVARLHPERRFSSLTGIAFPTGAKISSCEMLGGGLTGDVSYTYVLTCPPEETDRLIRELKLTVTVISNPGWIPPVGVRTRLPASWEIHEVWSPHVGDAVGGADFIELSTDNTHTKIVLRCGTT